MSSNSKLFSIGTINKRLRYPILTGLSHVFIRVGNNIISHYKDNYKKEEIEHPFIKIFFMFVGEFLSIILLLLELRLSKSTIKKTQHNLTIKSVLRITGLIFISCFIDFVASFSLKLALQGGQNTAFLELVFKLLSMGLTALLSQIILKTKYYIHHVVGLVILLFGVVFYGLVNAFPNFIGKTINDKYCWFLILFLTSSFLEIIEKYIMEVEFVNPYLVVAGEGFFGLILSGGSFLIFKESCPTSSFYICDKNYSYVDGFSYYFEHPLVTTGISFYFFGVIFFNAFRMKTNQWYGILQLIEL